MKLFVAAIAIVVLGVTGLCRGDDQREPEASSVEQVGADRPLAANPAQSGNVGEPTRPLKAVLYEVSREHTIQKRFVGSVVWHTDQVVSTDELPKLVIRADVEIPDLQVTVKLAVARNDDRAFRASHTVEIIVTLPRDFVHGGVINVPRILLKRAEATPGIPLNNVAVKITPGLFQIGLSNIGTDRQRNIELIKELSWIDLQILYSDGSWSILGLEKAPLDDRALAMLESPAVEPLPPRGPTNSCCGFPKPRPVAAPDPLLSRLFPKVPPRPS
jgi:hypothetical protein